MDDKYQVVTGANNRYSIIQGGIVVAEIQVSDNTLKYGSWRDTQRIYTLANLANEALEARKEKAFAEQAAKEAKAAMEPELPEPLPEGEENKGTWWNGWFYRGEM